MSIRGSLKKINAAMAVVDARQAEIGRENAQAAEKFGKLFRRLIEGAAERRASGKPDPAWSGESVIQLCAAALSYEPSESTPAGLVEELRRRREASAAENAPTDHRAALDLLDACLLYSERAPEGSP